MNPRVSIVIAIREVNSKLETAVRSALASDMHELEVLVVDNGAVDCSAAVVDRIADPRLLRVRARPEGGLSRARNVGIGRSRAPYVAFLDADDLLKADSLSQMLEALDRNPQAGFAFTDYEETDTPAHPIRRSSAAGFSDPPGPTHAPRDGEWRLIPQAQLARALTSGDFPGISGVAVRKHLLSEIGPFEETILYWSELDLWFRLAHRCGALYAERVGHTRTKSDRLASVSETARFRYGHDCITVLQREKSRWSDPWTRRQLDRRIAQSFADLGLAERNRRQRLRAMAMFVRAFATMPEVRWLSEMIRSVLISAPGRAIDKARAVNDHGAPGHS